MSIKLRIRLKLILIDVLFEFVVNSIILLVAYFTNRIIETILFYISWRVFRFAVPKIFHVKVKSPIMSVVGCGICSCATFIISTQLMLPIGISIFSSVVVGAIVNFILYKVQDYIDLKNCEMKEAINIYSMTEEDLRNYAKSKHISEQIIDTLILRVIHNYKWVEIQQQRNFTKDGIRYHKEQLNKKLNVKL